MSVPPNSPLPVPTDTLEKIGTELRKEGPPIERLAAALVVFVGAVVDAELEARKALSGGD